MFNPYFPSDNPAEAAEIIRTEDRLLRSRDPLYGRLCDASAALDRAQDAVARIGALDDSSAPTIQALIDAATEARSAMLAAIDRLGSAVARASEGE